MQRKEMKTADFTIR